MTLEELASGNLPDVVTDLIGAPEAWVARETGTHDVVR